MTANIALAAPGQIGRYLKVSIWFALASIVASVAFHFVFLSSNWFLLLEAGLLLYLAAVIWIRRRRATTETATTIVRLCLVQWILAGLLVLLDQWFIHLMPVIVLLPVLLATGEVDARRYHVLLRWAIAVTIAATLGARLLPASPFHMALSDDHRTAITLTFAPALVLAVTWVSWLSHATMTAASEQVLQTREKIRRADILVHDELTKKLTSVQAVAHRGSEVIDRWFRQALDKPVGVGPVDDLHQELVAAAGDLRAISHGLTVGGATAKRSRGSSVDEATGEQPEAAAEPRLLAALQVSAVFTVSCLAACILMYLFVLRQPLMLWLTGFIGVFQTLPSLMARFVAARAPVAAISLIAFAFWMPPAVFAYWFDIISKFCVPPMLIPIVISLPYLKRPRVLVLSVIGCVAIAATIAVAHLTDGAMIADDSPEWANNAIVVVLLPLGSWVVLWLGNRNHLALVARHRMVERSQRALERAHAQVYERIERDLHDGAQQRFVSACLRLGTARSAMNRGDDDAAKEHLVVARDELAVAADAAATLTLGPQRAMTPIELDAELRVLADRHPATSVAMANLPPMLPAAVVSTVWFCCAEAMTNTQKHAGPEAAIVIDLTGTDGGGLPLVITDDGRGFNTRSSDLGGGGVGLANLRDRLEALGGDLLVTSSVGGGTEVRGYIPPAAFGEVPAIVS